MKKILFLLLILSACKKEDSSSISKTNSTPPPPPYTQDSRFVGSWILDSVSTGYGTSIIDTTSPPFGEPLAQLVIFTYADISCYNYMNGGYKPGDTFSSKVWDTTNDSLYVHIGSHSSANMYRYAFKFNGANNFQASYFGQASQTMDFLFYHKK